MLRLTKVLCACLAALTITMASSANAQSGLDSFFADLFGPIGPAGRTKVSFRGPYNPGTIVVSFSDRRLYYVESKGTALSYPIAIPKAQARWSGTSFVSQKRENPSWTPTAEMRRENPKLPTFVPGGDPRNPMGVKALYLGSSLYRIHGTDAPSLIGREVSKGCVRMYNDDIADLYRRAKIGSRVVVTWQRFGGGLSS